MKRFFTCLFLGVFLNGVHAQEFKVTLIAPQYQTGLTYLTYHMGKNLNIEDSTIINNGKAVFMGKRTLLGGIYAIVLPGKTKSVDFFIDKEQDITVKLDTTDLLNKKIITGSKENDLFYQYEKMIADKGAKLEMERQAYKISTTKKDSALHEANYTKINKELNDYRDDVIKNHPNSMMTLYLKAMKEPEQLNKKLVTHQDSLDNYYYYKAHYWDGISFNDDRLIRTPFFLPKLEKFYREVSPPQPDSIIQDIDYKLLLARVSPEMYKFMLNWYTDEYINPKYMGQDAVFVHLFELYHSKGVSTWLNEKQNDIIKKRAYMLMANLIGLKAANLEMLDTSDRKTSLYEVKGDYTVVCFWDPNCGHCKEEIPHLDSIYNASWKKHNVRMFGVLTADNKPEIKKEWVNYIHEHKIDYWVNVYETKEMSDAITAAQKPSFRQLYDVTMTPTLYLLDKDKNIIGKKLTWQQLDELMHVKWSQTKP